MNGKDHHTEAVREIIGKPPSWLVRSGSTVFLVFLILFLILANLIQYPDLVSATIRIETNMLPVPIVAREGGKIDQLLVKPKEKVQKDQLLVLMKSNADFNEVQELAVLVDSVSRLLEDPARLSELNLPQYDNLGTLRDPYTIFRLKLGEYINFVTSGTFGERLTNHKTQMANLTLLENQLAQQKSVLESELKIVRERVATYRQLEAEGAVSKRELLDVETRAIGVESRIKNIDQEITRTALQKDVLNDQTLNLKGGFRESGYSKRLNFGVYLESLQDALETWEEKYCLFSPISGNVSFFQNWVPGQTIPPESELMTVVPPNEGLVGKITISGRDRAKIQEGQKVSIFLTAYPDEDFGNLSGTIQGVSLYPREGKFEATCQLNQGLITNHGHELPFFQGMEGQANIITNSKTLFKRIISRF